MIGKELQHTNKNQPTSQWFTNTKKTMLLPDTPKNYRKIIK